jgi:hypothetical protein
MDNNFTNKERELCDYYCTYVMLKNNAKTLDSFEFKALGWIKEEIQHKIEENKISEAKLKRIYREHIKNGKK